MLEEVFGDTIDAHVEVFVLIIIIFFLPFEPLFFALGHFREFALDPSEIHVGHRILLLDAHVEILEVGELDLLGVFDFLTYLEIFF